VAAPQPAPPEAAPPKPTPPEAPVTGALKVTGPEGGVVLLDGEEAGALPLALKDVEPGKHEVMLELDGRRSEPQSIDVAAGETVALQLSAPARVPVVADPRKVGAKGPRKRGAKGKLSLETQPWTRVWFGGRSLGDTPLLERPLPAGHHVLKLTNPEKGIKQQIEVEISPGQTTVMKLKL
jgi:serine/threonine-protein kinase